MKQYLFRLARSHTLGLSLVLLLGRFSGFIREIVLARTFGLTAHGDLAVIVLTLPDMFVGLLLAGGLSAALVPRLSALPAKKRGALFVQVSLVVGLVFAFLSALISFNPGGLLAVLAPGFINHDPAQTKYLLTIIATALPIAAMTGVSGALLNSNHRFLIVGSGNLAVNFVIISALVFGAWQGLPLPYLAWGVLGGVVVRYTMQLLPIIRTTPLGWGKSQFNKRLLHQFFAALVASSVVLLVPVFMRAIASLLGAGNLAALNYANKLVMLPVTVAISAISTVALPQLSKHMADGNHTTFVTDYAKSLRQGLKVAALMTLGGLVFADVVVHLLFGHGKFTPDQLQLVTDLTRIGFMSLPFVAISTIATAGLNAQGRQKALLLWTCASLVVLPLAAVPGLWLGSLRLQAWAVVVFQGILALSLSIAVVRFKEGKNREALI